METAKRSDFPCVKYCIFGCNVVFIVAGFSLAVLGVWLKTDARFRIFLSERFRQAVQNATWDAPTFYIFAYIFIVLGVVMIVVAFFGCCGAIQETRCLLIAYFICLFLLFVFTLGCGIYLLFRSDSIENELGDALTYMVERYYQGAGVVQEAMDQIQDTFRCCGNSGCGDYKQLRLDVPRSCDISCDGCRYRVYRALRDGFTIVTIIFVVVLGAEVLGFIFSIYLCCSAQSRNLYYYGPQSRILRKPPPQPQHDYNPSLRRQYPPQTDQKQQVKSTVLRSSPPQPLRTYAQGASHLKSAYPPPPYYDRTHTAFS